MLNNMLEGNGKLTRFILRRERIMSSIWILCLVLITIAIPPAFVNMYGQAQDRLAMAETMKNPAMIAMVGPVYGTDNYTIGAMNSNMMLLFTILTVGIMNIFLVIRHTRRDEERGRIEVIRSLNVGRLTTLSSTLTFAFIINLVLALVSGFGLAALRIDSMDLGGSMLYGACLGVSGLFFAAIAALFSQLSYSSKGAIGYSFIVLFGLYILRAVGDINNETLSRFSPMGLVLRAEVYVNNYWWPVLIVLLETIVIAAIAFYLNSIRDMDQGFIPARPGRKTASKFLTSPFGLAWRLLRTTIIGWIAGMFLLGISYGSIMGDLEMFLSKNELLMKMIPPSSSYSITELFITMIMSVMAMAATIPCISSMLKLRSEEKRNHNENLLARAVSKERLMGSYFIISMIGSFVMLFVTVFGLWSASSSVMAEPIAFSSLFKSMMVYLPAVWVSIGIAVLIVGLLPKYSSLSWLFLGYSFFTVYLGKVIGLPEWMAKISPFGNIPKLPMDDINYFTLTLLTIVAAVCIVVGFIAFRRRDSQG